MFNFSKAIKLAGADDGEWLTCPLVPGGAFAVRIRYLDPDSWEKLIKDATPAGRPLPDSDKTSRLVADRSIVDWRGLTKDALSVLFPGLTDEQVAEIPVDGVPATTESKHVLMTQHDAFFRWVHLLAKDRKAFVEARDEARKSGQRDA